MKIYQKYRAQQEALRDEEADDDMDAGIWGDEDEEELKSPVEEIIGSYVSYSCEAIGNWFSPFTILFVMWTEVSITPPSRMFIQLFGRVPRRFVYSCRREL